MQGEALLTRSVCRVAGALPRNVSLDGMRGVAALFVVLSHVVAGFAPSVYFGGRADEDAWWWTVFSVTPGFFVINGAFHVHLFFVLSAYVIAGSSDGARTPLLSQCAARIVRLSFPCAAAILLTYMLFKLDAMYMAKASEIVGHPWIERQYSDPNISWSHALAEALGTYYLTGGSILVPVLWTMQRELIGSIGIYIIFKSASAASTRLMAYVAIAALCVVARLEPQNYLCFVAGAAMYDLGVVKRRPPRQLVVAAIALGIFLGGKPLSAPSLSSIYFPLVHFADGMHVTGLIYPLGAMLLLFGALTSPTMQNILSGRSGAFLGKISFSLYLVHFPLLGSVQAAGFVYFGYTSSIALACVTLVYICVVLAVSTAFYAVVERPTLGLLRSIKRAHRPQLAT